MSYENKAENLSIISFLFSNFIIMKITNELLIERLQHLENNQYAENTIENYFTDVKLFLEWLKNKNNLQTISSENLKLIEIENRKTILWKTLTPKTSIYYTVRPTISQQTIQSKLTAIKSFLKYINVFYDEWFDYRKIQTKRIKSDYIECITDDEFQTFKSFIWTYEKYKINALRSQLLVNIGYTSWLRLSEMLNLTIQEIQNKECRITGKWNKTRRVFFTNSTLEILEDYLTERSKPTPWTGKDIIKSSCVFVSHNSWYDFWKPLKKNTVCERIKKYSDELNLGKRITVHSLRHSYATRLLESGLNIREIQELLGHCDIQTTQNYCHVLKSGLKSKVMQVFT